MISLLVEAAAPRSPEADVIAGSCTILAVLYLAPERLPGILAVCHIGGQTCFVNYAVTSREEFVQWPESVKFLSLVSLLFYTDVEDKIKSRNSPADNEKRCPCNPEKACCVSGVSSCRALA